MITESNSIFHLPSGRVLPSFPPVRHGCPAAPSYEQLRLTGLKKNARCRITSLAQAIRVGQSGNLLKHVAPVNIDPNGQCLRLADRHFMLPYGEKSMAVSGAALISGILLRPMFRGTGYDKNQRTHCDFGSDIDIVEEMGR